MIAHTEPGFLAVKPTEGSKAGAGFSALTVAQVASELQVAEVTVRRWIRSGGLDAVLLPSGRVRIPVEAIRRLPHVQPAAKQGVPLG